MSHNTGKRQAKLRPSSGVGDGPKPWPLPPRLRAPNESGAAEPAAAVAREGHAAGEPRHVLPGGGEVSESIYRRIETLYSGVRAGDSDGGNKMRPLHIDDTDEFPEETFATPIADEYNSVTFIDDDDDDVNDPERGTSSAYSEEMASFSAENGARGAESVAAPRLTALFGGEDGEEAGDGVRDAESSSSSEEEDAATSPKYAVWLSPPRLDSFHGAAPQTESAKEEEEEEEQAEPHAAPKADSSKKLRSTPEQERLKRYMRRIQEEERARGEERRRQKPSTIVPGPSFSLAPPAADARKVARDAPQLNLADLDLDAEELVFTPVFDGWGELQPDGARASPRARNFPKRLRPPPHNPFADRGTASRPPPRVHRGVDLAAEARASAADDEAQAESIRLGDTFYDPRPRAAASPERAARGLRLLRTLSLKRGGGGGGDGGEEGRAGAARAQEVQRGLGRGFEMGEARRTELVVLGDVGRAVQRVAAACQTHLQLAVFLRQSGDKLRVENRAIAGARLRVCVRFRALPDAPRCTLVAVRMSRLERGHAAADRVWEFFVALVTQLDIEGHIPPALAGRVRV